MTFTFLGYARMQTMVYACLPAGARIARRAHRSPSPYARFHQGECLKN